MARTTRSFLLVTCAAALLLPLAGCGSKEPVVVPAKAELTNVTRPGSIDFKVGDSFRLVLTGAPGKIVKGSVGRNGDRPIPSTYGKTDAAGTLVITGVMQDVHVATWHEEWSVGGSKAPPLDFAVRIP